MTVAELQQRMSSREFTEWMAFYQLEPFGPWRDDIRIGVLGASLAPLLGDFKGARPTPEMFMPAFHDKIASQREDPDAMYRKLLTMTRAMGGTVLHG